MKVSGHKTLAEAQKYIDAVDQKRMAEAARAEVVARSKPAQAVTDAEKRHDRRHLKDLPGWRAGQDETANTYVIEIAL